MCCPRCDDQPDPKVIGWLDTIDEDRCFISVASIAELKQGIALMADGRRRAALAAWLGTDLPARFADRILPIDQSVAERWGELMADSRRDGIALSVMDGFFAATALAKSLMLVTRNIRDFASLGVPLFDPWND